MARRRAKHKKCRNELLGRMRTPIESENCRTNSAPVSRMKGGRTRPRARRSSLERSFGEGPEVGVDCLGGAAAVGEGSDDEVGAVDVVAASEDAGTRRHVRV